MIKGHSERFEQVEKQRMMMQEIYFASLYSMVHNKLDSLVSCWAKQTKLKPVKFDELISPETRQQIKKSEKKVVIPANIEVLKCLVPSS